MENSKQVAIKNELITLNGFWILFEEERPIKSELTYISLGQQARCMLGLMRKESTSHERCMLRSLTKGIYCILLSFCHYSFFWISIHIFFYFFSWNLFHINLLRLLWFACKMFFNYLFLCMVIISVLICLDVSFPVACNLLQYRKAFTYCSFTVIKCTYIN